MDHPVLIDLVSFFRSLINSLSTEKSFNVGKYLEFEIEFRTSELNGVLLSVSEPNGYPALSLELFMGKVVLSCDLGDGNTFHLESDLSTKFALCDNKWHTISGLFNSKEIAFRVDQQQPIGQLLEARRNGTGKVTTKSPLYIGGLPGGIELEEELQEIY